MLINQKKKSAQEKNVVKMKYLKKETLFWFAWLILVIIWNYGYPVATPLEDVSVAVFLSLFFIVVQKKK